MDGPLEYYAKQNKSGRKSEEPYDVTHTWDMKPKLVDTGNSMAVTRGKGGEAGGAERGPNIWWRRMISLVGRHAEQYTDHVS